MVFGQKKYSLQQQQRYEYQPRQRQQYQQQVDNDQYERFDQQQQYESSYSKYPEPQGPIVERNYETDNRYYKVRVYKTTIISFNLIFPTKGGR